MNEIDSFRINLSLNNEGLVNHVGLFSYLSKLSFRRRTETIRMLLVIGFLMIQGKLQISAVTAKHNEHDTDNKKDPVVQEALSGILSVIDNIE